MMFTRLNIGDAYFNFNYDFDGIATPGRNVVNRPNKGIAINDTYPDQPADYYRHSHWLRIR